VPLSIYIFLDVYVFNEPTSVLPDDIKSMLTIMLKAFYLIQQKYFNNLSRIF